MFSMSRIVGERSLLSLSLISVLAYFASAVPPIDLPIHPKINLPRFISDDSSIVHGRYIVQFSRPPSASVTAQRRESLSSQDLEREALMQHESFDVYCRDKQVPVKVKSRFVQLFNGASFTLRDHQGLSTIASAPGVKAIFPVIRQHLYPFHRKPLNFDTLVPQYAHALTNVDQVHAKFPNLTGHSVKVGVIDTGIDWRHPAFAVPGQKCEVFKGPGCRVLYGHDFVGDAYDSNADLEYNKPAPDNDPVDCQGHGTHVGGIIGGYDGNKIKGVAPQVTLGAYKIFGCLGGTDNVVVLSALEKAYDDGMSIVNLSLGGSIVGSDSPYAQAIDTLCENNIYVIAAASNDGDQGLFRVTAPSVASKAISVGSYDNSHTYEIKATVFGAENMSEFAYGYNADTKDKFDAGKKYRIINSPTGGRHSNVDACETYSSSVFSGGVALIRRGGCTFTDKVLHAIIAGAQGVIVYSNAPPRLRGGVLDESVVRSIPVVFTDAQVGEKLYDAVANGKVKVQFLDVGEFHPSDTNGQPSDFSSWGPDINLLIKPDISAPGGNIYSSYSTEKGSYSQISGTSMSSPFIAGLIALDVQKNGVSLGLSSFQNLICRLSTTARPAFLPNDPSTAESVAKVGGGLVDALRFLTNHVSITPHKLELGDTPKWPQDTTPNVQTMNIRNEGPESVTYRLSHTPSRAVMGDNQRCSADLVFANVHATVTFSVPEVVVRPGETKSLTVSVIPTNPDPPLEPGHWIYSGYVAFKSHDGDLHVPYAVMAGDFSTMSILGSNTTSQPVLTNGFALNPLLRNYSTQYTGDAQTPVFSLDPDLLNEIPVVSVSTLFPTRILAVSVHDASVPETPLVGFAIKGEYLSPLQNGYLEIIGKVSKSLESEELLDLPNGEYVLCIQVAKPTALMPVIDIDGALTSLWTSPKFRINRDKFKPSS